MGQNRTKKQHYIAQSIIRIFFDSKTVYEKNLKNNKIYQCSVNDTMCMSNSYELSFLDDNFLENLFAQSIDLDSSNLVKKIKTLLSNGDCESAKNELNKGIRMFLINYYKSLTSLIHFSNDMSKKDQSSVVRMLERIFDTNYIDRISKLLISHYDLYFLCNNNENFLLSDQYISTCSLKFKGRFVNISNREIGLKDTMVLIPISKRFYAIYINGLCDSFRNLDNNMINDIDVDLVNNINEVIYNNSYEKCISTNKDSLEVVYKKNASFGDSMAYINFSSGAANTYKLKQEVFFNESEYEMYRYYDNMTWATNDFKMCKVNDLCPCGSGKKFKKCCKNKVDRCKSLLNTMHYNQKSIMIDEKLGFEDPILLPNSIGEKMKEPLKK